MEVTTLIGKLMLELSKKTKGNEKEYEQFLEKIIEIVNSYEVENDNTKLLKWMDVLLQKVVEEPNALKGSVNSSLMGIKSERGQLRGHITNDRTTNRS